jgi:hypothetical protein
VLDEVLKEGGVSWKFGGGTLVPVEVRKSLSEGSFANRAHHSGSDWGLVSLLGKWMDRVDIEL